MVPAAQDESLIWAADLLASLDLPDSDEEQEEAEEEDQTEPEVLSAFQEEFGELLSETELEGETDTFFDALFGWIFEFFEALFGEDEDPETQYASPPADVSEDLIFIPLEPDAELLASLEEDDVEEELDLVF